MLIKFSKPSADHADTVAEHAAALGVFAFVKWSTPREVRFDLQPRKDSFMPVSSETWERLIKQLLEHDPDAHIKTAWAVYRGLGDYERQTA